MKKADLIIVEKINELEQEMKQAGLWQKEAPGWVNYFEEKNLSLARAKDSFYHDVILVVRLREGF